MLTLESPTPFAIGGYARLYRAFDSELRRTVALKVDGGSSGSDERGLMHEFRALQTVSGSAYFPEVYSCKRIFSEKYPQLNGKLCMAMELLEGRTLKTVVESTRNLSERKTLDYAKHATLALSVLHGCGLAHRDLHPGNIMMTLNGLKIIDLGVSCTTGGPYNPGLLRNGYSPNAALSLEQADLYMLALGLVAARYGRRLSPNLLPDTRLGRWLACCIDPDPRKRFIRANQAFQALIGAHVA
ncbi:protein kinase domain-containing protein [Slackia heliotrinireducens]|uniref:protein kinase domain-containing protein n=1 Tax=Slackia heliotrinireducens TaxID=84110 RepID=UPI00331575E5